MGALFVPRKSAEPAWGRTELRRLRVMASPPTVTSGTAVTLAQKIYAGTFGGNAYALGQNASRFTVSRTEVDTAGAGVALVYKKTITTNTGVVPNTYGAMTISFIHDGSDVELIIYNATGGVLIKIDDEYVSLTPQAIATAPTIVKLAFGSRAYRRIDVIGGSGGAWGFVGVAVNASETIFPAPRRGPRVLAVGHSFTSSGPEGWSQWFGHAMGWDDVWPSGVGGTGYLSTAGGASKKFRDRLATDVIPFNPDIVLFLAGANDASASAATLAAEMAACVTTVKTALPGALVIGSNDAIGGVETMTSLNLDQRDAGKAAWEAAGGIWLDMTEMPMTAGAAGRPQNTLAFTYAAGRAGSSGFPHANTAGTSGFNVGDTVEIGSGATRERFLVTDIGLTSGYWHLRFAGSSRYAHNAGEVMKVVAPSYMTGIGKVGATTGVGNADILVSNDGVHPQNPDGYRAIGYVWAALVNRYLNRPQAS